MPNPFFRAKSAWDSGDTTTGFAFLDDHLSARVGHAVFRSSPRLFYAGAFPRLEVAVFSMMNDNTILQWPFGIVFAELWRLNPNDIWIALLLHHALKSDADHGVELSELDDEKATLAEDVEAIVSVLVESAEKGLLAPDFEGPNNGRPILRIADIGSTNNGPRGLLAAELMDRLTKGYARCPPDFWTQLAQTEPEDVLTRFLHDLFLEFNHSIDVAESRWKVIVDQQQSYATAAVTALDLVIQGAREPQWLLDVVQIDAGFTTVRDGRAWLAVLKSALARRNFSALAA